VCIAKFELVGFISDRQVIEDIVVGYDALGLTGLQQKKCHVKIISQAVAPSVPGHSAAPVFSLI
jgi:hypothetical protein